MVRLDTQAIRVTRSGAGEPLVLLHCLGVDRRFWDFAADLENTFELVRYDFPGHGRTPVPGTSYAIGDLADQLARVLTRQSIARAHLAGISLGGLVAQHFAATYPDRVGRLVLIDTTPRYTDELRAVWAERAATARTSGVSTLADGILKIWFSPPFIAADAPAVRYVREQLARTPPEGYALACEALAAADLRPLASRIAAPTLVVCGDKDIPSFLDSAKWLADNIRNAELAWIAGGHHASVLEKPEQAVRLMRRFLASAGPGERLA
jgi:3-oxoadipate enol-lactonase